MTDQTQLLRDALRRIQLEAVSLADAQVIALESLSAPTQPASGEAVAYRETITGRLCEPDDEHRRKFPMCYRPLAYADDAPPDSQEQAQ